MAHHQSFILLALTLLITLITSLTPSSPPPTSSTPNPISHILSTLPPGRIDLTLTGILHSLSPNGTLLASAPLSPAQIDEALLHVPVKDGNVMTELRRRFAGVD
ncbi:MAG: hypothetical protein Q9160_009000, partial [Pyrenula sp. 1 TL-2023]